MLPVAPGQPGNGPWTVETWPNDGCAACSIDKADLGAVQEVVRDLLTSGEESAVHSKIPVYVVRGGLDDGQTSVAKLKRALADCRFGSSGVLSTNDTTQLVAFGVRIDCEKSKRSNFMSVVMGDDHVPVAIYWMPDGPIIAAEVGKSD
jgi:hypothetical protein